MADKLRRATEATRIFLSCNHHVLAKISQQLPSMDINIDPFVNLMQIVLTPILSQDHL